MVLRAPFLINGWQVHFSDRSPEQYWSRHPHKFKLHTSESAPSTTRTNRTRYGFNITALSNVSYHDRMQMQQIVLEFARKVPAVGNLLYVAEA